MNLFILVMAFLFVPYLSQRRYLVAAYKCINENDLWDWYRDPINPFNGNFNNCNVWQATIVFGALMDVGCDGCLLPLTLRSMQTIARVGLACYERLWQEDLVMESCKSCSYLKVPKERKDEIDCQICSCLNQNGLMNG